MQAGATMDLGGVVVERDLAAPMRDGVVLRADVYRPSGLGEYPVLMQRTPYDKRFAQTGVYQHPAWYARQGYIVIVQDVRGRFASDGVFDPYRHEALDGFDSIAWAASLQGSSGKVGTFGFSYAGVCQLMAAALRPPALAAAAVGMAGSDFYDGWTYRGGALQLAFILSWTVQALAPPDAIKAGDREVADRLRAIGRHLPDAYRRPLASWVRSGELPAYLDRWLEHDTDDGYWKSLNWPAPGFASVPCLHIGGWYDVFLPGTLANYAVAASGEISPRTPQHLVIGPWQHVPWASSNGSVHYGASGNNTADALQIAWFDRHLKGRPSEPELPPVRYFSMGSNVWHQSATWPPEGAVGRDLYLRSSGRANSLSGDGALSLAAPAAEPPDIYVFDPAEPVPSVGGSSCCRADVAPIGAFDQRGVEIRNDVLVFTTAPLEADWEVAGPVALTLFAATDGPDTDWTAKLVDVHPDGQAINLCDGIIRARYRDSLVEPKPLEPGRTYEYRIDLGATANCFRQGHAIRLEVSSSNFPAYDVNDNTGAIASERDPLRARIATQAVFHDSTRPSRLRLFVADG